MSLTEEQKREYLRLFLNEGAEAADNYRKSLEPRRWVFDSQEDIRRYEQETGKPLTGWIIILGKEET
jgi:hypothetical protein